MISLNFEIKLHVDIKTWYQRELMASSKNSEIYVCCSTVHLDCDTSVEIDTK